MKIGIIGLGRMGRNIARRLLRDGHRCVVYDIDSAAAASLIVDGAVATTSVPELVGQLDGPRTVWVMVPAGVTGAVIDELATLMASDDVIIDGGNSHYRESRYRSAYLGKFGVFFVDVGTSGGVHGLDRGYCLMIGGPTQVVERLDPIFRSLSPGITTASTNAGRPLNRGTAEHGYLHCGAAGAGHFVKMVHNGIEYGQMAALAEGLAILDAADVGLRIRATDAETAPISDAEHYDYVFDVAAIAEVWRRGSVIGSWLLDLTAASLRDDPTLSDYSGRVADSGEGRWVVHAAIDEGIPAHVLTAALYERFSSRGKADYSNKVLSAMRHAFGGHHEKETIR